MWVTFFGRAVTAASRGLKTYSIARLQFDYTLGSEFNHPGVWTIGTFRIQDVIRLPAVFASKDSLRTGDIAVRENRERGGVVWIVVIAPHAEAAPELAGAL